MLTNTGYFKTMPCPFFDMGFCERPFCHFKHRRKEDQQPKVPIHNPTESVTADLKTDTRERPQTLELKKEIKGDPDAAPVAGPSSARDVPRPTEGPDLKHLVEEAVKKVLLGGGVDPRKLLSEIDTSSIISQVKKEQTESEDEVMIIEDDEEEKPIVKLTPSPSKHKLYLPPENCPAYHPTPIKDLQRRQSESRNVLGDIGDLSDSDQEYMETPDVLGNILKDGNKSGVLSGGISSEFQERVMAEKLKLERRNIEQLEQCDKVSSSSPKQDDFGTKDDVDDDNNMEEEEETEEDSAERKLREKEDEIRKLEEKRKLLENYYKKKLQEKVVSDKIEEKSKVKSRSSPKKKRKVEDISDSEDENSSGSSSSSSGRHRHKRKRRSKSKSKRSKHRSRGRSRNESKKHKRKSRRRSPSSSSSYSENPSSNVSSRSTSEKPVAKHKKSDKFPSTKDPKIESSNEFQSTEAAIKKLLESSKTSPHPPAPAKIKVKSISQLIEDKGEEAEEVFSDTDQLEGKSFLESVEKLDKLTSKSSEKTPSRSSHKHKKSSSSDKKSKSSSHKSSSSSSRHKSSSSSSRHKSHHKSSSHKSSRDKSRKSERKPREVEESKEDRSPVPDFSEELAMLPDFSLEDTGDNFDNITDGLEEMFAGVEDEDELQKIFQQYEPEATTGIDSASLKKQKQLDEREKSAASSSVLGKKRVAHGGPEASEKRPLHMKKPSLRTPAQAMHDRYKKLQQMRQQQMIEKKLTELTEEPAEDPGEGPSSSSSSMSGKVRVAHTGSSSAPPPVMNKARQQLMAREKVRAVAATPAVTNAKGSQRVAHTPGTEAVRRPMVTPDRSSKVPTTVRQKYLNSIIEECLKISGGDELEAYTRAEREEKECCRKATSRMFYLNLIVNCIKKLRTEAAAVASRSSRPRPQTESLTEKRNLLTTHLQVLAGKKGTIGTWSNERTANLSVSEVDEKLLFAVMKKYVMTEEQLVENGYPRADPTDPSRVTMKKDRFGKVDPEKARLVAMDDEKRLCDRCGEIYLVSEDGRQVTSQQCVYHWGRLFKRKGNRVTGATSLWSCCDGTTESEGCQVSQSHVCETVDFNNMRGFVTTIDKGEGERKVLALDCEMVNTTVGTELCRVTMIDYTGDTCYESLVLPDNHILDHNTRFSGIKPEHLEGVKTKLRDVQAQLLFMIDSKDILIGHSLESDLRALKLLHPTVVDTSVVFPHKRGPPFKRALRTLAEEHLKRIIQNDADGHDSKEDALACLDIMKRKVTDDISKLQSQARANSSKRRDNFLTDPDNVTLN